MHKRPLETFLDAQRHKIAYKTIYNQADFQFWVASLEINRDDLVGLREAWVEHSQAFPESKSFMDVEREVHRADSRVVIISMFMSEFEKADLKDKSLGWSVYPVPQEIKELSDSDQVIRALFPVENPWARYFLVRYPTAAWNSADNITVGNKNFSAELPKQK